MAVASKQEKTIYTIQDHDNWITNDWKSGSEIHEAYLFIAPGFIGINRTEFTEFFIKGIKKIDNNPGLYGWRIDGIIRAAAENDPFLHAQTALQLALDMIMEETKSKWTEEQIQTILNDVHGEAYQTIIPVFRDGIDNAREYVEEMNVITNSQFVSNSNTEKIYRRLAYLYQGRKPIDQLKEEIEVVGGAKKQWLDGRLKTLPEAIHVEGIPTPWYARRGRYARRLATIGPGVPNENKFVTGDHTPMDLIVPIFKGYNTILMNNPGHTLSAEVNFVKKQPGGHVVETLEGAAQVIREAVKDSRQAFISVPFGSRSLRK